MEIKIRPAKLRDKGLFRKLWTDYMNKSVNNSKLIPNKQNLNVFTQLFEVYLANPDRGFVLFIAQNTVAIGGDPFSPFEYTFGKTGTLWGKHSITELKPEVDQALDEEIYKRFKDLGYACFAKNDDENNDLKQVVVYRRIEDGK